MLKTIFLICQREFSGIFGTLFIIFVSQREFSLKCKNQIEDFDNQIEDFDMGQIFFVLLTIYLIKPHKM